MSRRWHSTHTRRRRRRTSWERATLRRVCILLLQDRGVLEVDVSLHPRRCLWRRSMGRHSIAPKHSRRVANVPLALLPGCQRRCAHRRMPYVKHALSRHTSRRRNVHTRVRLRLERWGSTSNRRWALRRRRPYRRRSTRAHNPAVDPLHIHLPCRMERRRDVRAAPTPLHLLLGRRRRADWRPNVGS